MEQRLVAFLAPVLKSGCETLLEAGIEKVWAITDKLCGVSLFAKDSGHMIRAAFTDGLPWIVWPAQNALGHNSRAVHQAYAREGIGVCPSLEDYEQTLHHKIVPFPKTDQK